MNRRLALAILASAVFVGLLVVFALGVGPTGHDHYTTAVRVRVVNSKTGEPVQGAVVWLVQSADYPERWEDWAQWRAEVLADLEPARPEDLDRLHALSSPMYPGRTGPDGVAWIGVARMSIAKVSPLGTRVTFSPLPELLVVEHARYASRRFPLSIEPARGQERLDIGEVEIRPR
ncbi:MAG: hypothetical protein ACYTEG_02215 [Planctomycetota bacterium]